MKISKDGTIRIPRELVTRFGLEPGEKIQVEVSRQGFLVKPADSHRTQVDQWLRDEHGSELATLTTDQVMRLLQEDGE